MRCPILLSPRPKSIPLILLAPPPVLDPCAASGSPLTCGIIDGRLADLADDLALVATDKGVLFLDLYAAFLADPAFGLAAVAHTDLVDVAEVVDR